MTEKNAGKNASHKAYWICFLILYGLSAVLLLVSWKSHSFCDWYARYILPVWYNTYGRLTSLFSFAVGEWMVIIAACSLIFALLFWIPAVILKIRNKARGFRRFTLRFYAGYLIFVGLVLLIMVLNCFILYHCTPLDPNPEKDNRQYLSTELYALDEYLCAKANDLAETLPRDEDGWLLYDGDLQTAAEEALHNIESFDPRLKGWYPDMKPIHFSNMLTHMGVSGIFLPFSMECSYNDLMYIGNIPDVFCHELSHGHGFLWENEANFIAFLACTQSDDPFLQYCGYLSVLCYVNDSVAETYAAEVSVDPNAPLSKAYWSDYVMKDLIFLKPEDKKKLDEEDKAITDIVSEEKMDELQDTFSEINLKANGVSSGNASYGEVVGLLLQYYDGVLY